MKLAQIAECEKRERRVTRLRQVRAQSATAAKDVLERVRQEEKALMAAAAQTELAKYIKAKEEQLSHLEAQYQSALAQVGLGHEGAREQEEYVRWKKKREAEQERAAKTRGKAALQAELQKEKMKQQVQYITHLQWYNFQL